MRRTARTSSKANPPATDPSRPESPPVPDESFWGDTATTDNSAWLATLASAPSDISTESFTAADAVTAEPGSPPAPGRAASPFAALSDWVEPMEIEPVAAAAPPPGYSPPAPEAAAAVQPDTTPLDATTSDGPAAVMFSPVAAQPNGTPEPLPEPAPEPLSEPAAMQAHGGSADRPEIGGTADDEDLMREVMFSPVPAAPAPEPPPVSVSGSAEAADPNAWMNVSGLDDLLPGR